MSKLAKIWSDPHFIEIAQGNAKKATGHAPNLHGAGDDDGLEPPESPEKPVVLIKIIVEPVNPDMDAGERRQFTATGVYADRSTRDLTREVKWSSLPDDVVSIDDSGMATADHKSGTATITAMDRDTLVRGSLDVTVTVEDEPQAPDEKPPPDELPPGESPPEEEGV